MPQKPKRIFISNRLPFSIDVNGELKRGSGGLVSALLGVSLDEPFAWLGFETDEKVAKILEEKDKDVHPQMELHPVLLSKELYTKYYDGFANDIIWPLFHYEAHLANFNRNNWEAYKKANQKMAEAIAKVANPGDTVWIHDFHFLLLPQMLRQLISQVKIGFFLHIPFPAAELFRQLPVREEILRGLIQSDLIGFHEHSYLRQFIVSLTTTLGIDSSFFRAELDGHTAHLGVFPISIETDLLKEKASSAAVLEKVESYKAMSTVPFTILGIDRLDYTKGLELKLRGFQQALRKYPDMVSQVSLLQVAVPTREKVPAYMKIKKEVEQLVGAINGEFGKPDYTPVHYIFNSVSETELLALYRKANAALITSKRDGMNLVAMEYVVSQDLATPGSLILSEFAGAASLLSDALIVNPWDVDATADAIYKAFKMSYDERFERMAHLQDILSRYSSTKWAEGFLSDLERIQIKNTKRGAQELIPKISSWPTRLLEFLRKDKVKIVLDYDGTVVALTRRPEQAVLLSETKDLLLSLHDHLDVFVLSGRSKKFLDLQFDHLPIDLAAEHGAFYRISGGDWQSRISSDISSWYPYVEKVMNDYAGRVPLSFVEKKSASLVWHFRQSPEDFAMYQAKKLDDELQVGMSNEPVTVAMGSRIVEAKAIECNKGSFLRWLMQNSDPDTAYICIGDDRTDEDMFKTLGDKGFSIKVGAGISDAQYRLFSQKEVVIFLEELLKYMENKNNQGTRKGEEDAAIRHNPL